MKILMTGATGFIGKQILKDLLRLEIAPIHILTREASSFKNPSPSLISVFEWKEPKVSLPPKNSVEGVSHIIHLAGASVAKGRWTEKRKKELYDSRVLMSKNLIKAMDQSSSPPPCLISSSAIGYYGDRGDELLFETSEPSNDFLGQLCQDWEMANANSSRISRVVHIRTGLVLGEKGGALKPMLIPFKLGLGGPLGSGKQFTSWIHLKDLSSLFIEALHNENIRGPINGVSPNPISNKIFTKTLGKVLKRPAILPVPLFALKLIFGEKSSLLSSSQRVSSQKIQDLGFAFRYPELREALQEILHQ